MRTRLIAFSDDRAPDMRRIRLGFEGDNLVERLEFYLPAIAERQTATLMITGADAVALDPTEDGRYAVNLTRDMIGPDGEREAYIRIDGEGDKAWQSSPMRMITGALPDVETEIEKQHPTAVGQMLGAMAEHRTEMEDALEAAEDAARRAEEAADKAGNGGGGTADTTDLREDIDNLADQIRSAAPDFSASGPAPICRPLAGDPLTVLSHIDIQQEGSGDPSPDNVRPIVRHDHVEVTVTSDDGVRTVRAELDTPVIRGSFNWATGATRNNARIRDMGAATPVETGTSSTGVRYVRLLVDGTLTQLLACNRYRVTTALPTESGYIRIIGTAIYIYDNAIDFDNPTAAYAGTEVVEPDTETVAQNEPVEVLAGKGINTIVSSTGSTEVSGKAVLDVYSRDEVDDALDLLAEAIPAPYTLPPATADTLGGVKIGEGLTVKEDGRAGVDPQTYYTKAETDTAISEATNETEFELIDTITINEGGIYQVYLNTEPNGTLYNFKKVLVQANSAAASATLAKNIYFVDSQGKRYQCYIKAFSTTKEQKSWGYIEVRKDGVIFTESGYVNSASYDNADESKTRYRKEEPDITIKRVEVFAGANGLFPVGTTINIWGVRA